MNRRSTTFALFLLLSLLPMGVAAQSDADRVGEIFARWNTPSSPGCAVGVTRAGEPILEVAYGMSDLEYGIANTPESIFEGGSLSKQFTAAAVVLLALDGALSLDDDVREYVPELPDYGATITLKHLMTHTSGLRDWGSVAAISGWGREQRSHTHDHVIDILSRQTALNFEPGHEYSYSNSGYNLLAVIVARVSGQSFADFSRERIFEPLGLEHTQWRDDYRRLVPGRTTAYNANSDGSWRINRPIEFVHGNGGILTTVGDLALWNSALTNGQLGGPDFVRLMHDRGVLNDGSHIRYAGGLVIADLGGVPNITHTGATAGYRAFLGRYPEQQLSVAMLCNASNVSTGGFGNAIAEVFLGDAVRAPVAPNPVSVPDTRLQRYAGLYRDPVNGQTRTLRVVNGRLQDGGIVLTPVSPDRFQVGTGPRFYDFRDGPQNRPMFRIDSWEYSDQRFEQVDPWQPSTSELAQFAGEYHSTDAETTFSVRMEGDHLVLRRRPGVEARLTPVYPNAFRSGGRILRFDAERMRLSVARVYDMVFQKQR